jgi:hypothetical protein
MNNLGCLRSGGGYENNDCYLGDRPKKCPQDSVKPWGILVPCEYAGFLISFPNQAKQLS